jgi:hypothetical protein
LSIKVEFGFAPAGQAVNFNDISLDVISVAVNRGKDPQQETFNAASCSIQLNNETRNYDPDYGPSPYQGQIVPTGEVRVYKEDQIVFTGFITDWNFAYSPSGESIAEIVASDAFWNLNNQTLTDYAPNEQSSSNRILSVLARPEVGGTAVWPVSQRVISAGIATVGDYEVADGTNALSYLQEVEKAEPGRLFIDKEGRIVFRSRNNDLENPSFEYTRTNLSYNPSFENNTNYWVPSSGTFTRSTAQAYIGTASASLSAGGVVTQFFPSQISSEYSVSVYARASSGSVSVAIAGVRSEDNAIYNEVNPVSYSVGGTAWTRISTQFQANSIYSGLKISQTPSSNAVFLDAVLIEESPILDAYFDGANNPVYNTTDPNLPDYQPARAFETYDTEWLV